MARIKILSARQVETLKPGFYADGGNLFLRVRETGARSWVFRYKTGSKVIERGMGATTARTLAQAREIAGKMRTALADGQDPATILRAKSDVAFNGPANAGSDLMPASVTYGAPSFVSSGASVTNIDEDLAALIQPLVDAGSDLTFAAWVMLPRTAIYLSRLRGTADGALSFPFINAKGGVLAGLPVVTSGILSN